MVENLRTFEQLFCGLEICFFVTSFERKKVLKEGFEFLHGIEVIQK